MKSVSSLLALFVIAGIAAADIPPERKILPPPQNLYVSDQPGIAVPGPALPDNPPGIDRPARSPRRSNGPSDTRFRGQPRDLPRPVPGYEDPVAFDQVSDNPPVGDWPLGIGGQPGGPWRIPVVPPVFPDRIDVRFGPGFGRLHGQVRLHDMSGRVVLAESFSADGGLSVSAGSLPAGSYLLELDCGPGFVMKGKAVKFD